MSKTNTINGESIDVVKKTTIFKDGVWDSKFTYIPEGNIAFTDKVIKLTGACTITVGNLGTNKYIYMKAKQIVSTVSSAIYIGFARVSQSANSSYSSSNTADFNLSAGFNTNNETNVLIKSGNSSGIFEITEIWVEKVLT